MDEVYFGVKVASSYAYYNERPVIASDDEIIRRGVTRSNSTRLAITFDFTTVPLRLRATVTGKLSPGNILRGIRNV